MCISLKEEVYKDYLVNLFNYYDNNNKISVEDFKLNQVEYQP